MFIIPQSGIEALPQDLHDSVMTACRNGLADFKAPREIRFVDEMPRATLEKGGESRVAEDAGVAMTRHSGMVRRTRPQMRNCASGNLEIPGSMLRFAPE